MTFEQFVDLVDKNYYENVFEMRYGQTIMNTLYRVWPVKYNEIKTTDSDFDCFYDDRTAKSTLDYLEKSWDESIINRNS